MPHGIFFSGEAVGQDPLGKATSCYEPTVIFKSLDSIDSGVIMISEQCLTQMTTI